MPIPAILLALAGAAAAAGVGTGANAIRKNKEAKEVNAQANSIYDKARTAAEQARSAANTQLEEYGERKLNVLDKTMNQYLSVFSQIHSITLKESEGINELLKFRMDKQSVKAMRELVHIASSIIGGVVGGAGAGALAAFGAYSATMTFAAASTGTAIASLSGAAATNATLAFLGGGALAAGGGGIALGTTVLGGVVAGPAIAVLGIAMNASASKNLNKAYSNKFEAQRMAEELKTVTSACRGISNRCEVFISLLNKLSELLEKMTHQLEWIVSSSGCDYSAYTDAEQAVVAMSLSVAGAIKKILDTPILAEDGSVTKESKAVEKEIRAYIYELNGASEK